MGFDFTPNSENDLYQSAITEAINLFGIEIEYWRTDRDDTKDTLYNEDIYPNVRLKFWLKAMTHDAALIHEIFNLGKYGFQSSDQFDLTISKKQWDDAYVGATSAEPSGPFNTIPDTGPRAGDFVYIKYMGRVFMLSTVEREDHIFHQEKMAYRLHLVAADSEGASINPEISAADDPYDQLGDPSFPNSNPLLNDDAEANTPEITGILIDKQGDRSPWS